MRPDAAGTVGVAEEFEGPRLDTWVQMSMKLGVAVLHGRPEWDGLLVSFAVDPSVSVAETGKLHASGGATVMLGVGREATSLPILGPAAGLLAGPIVDYNISDHHVSWGWRLAMTLRSGPVNAFGRAWPAANLPGPAGAFSLLGLLSVVANTLEVGLEVRYPLGEPQVGLYLRVGWAT